MKVKIEDGVHYDTCKISWLGERVNIQWLEMLMTWQHASSRRV